MVHNDQNLFTATPKVETHFQDVIDRVFTLYFQISNVSIYFAIAISSAILMAI